MKSKNATFYIGLMVAAWTAPACSQSAAEGVFPDAPAGFDVRRDGIEQGRVERIAYDSSVVRTGAKDHGLIWGP